MTRACYLISYDIPDNKRRLKIAHLLEGYGERVQYSVFEVWVTEKQLEQLQSRLEHWIAVAADKEEAPGSVRIYPLCAACRKRREVLGEGRPTEEPELWVI
jgi:CRISPR-associated protein Cas2